MDREGMGRTGLSTTEPVAAAHPACPLLATMPSRTQGPQVGTFHLGLSRLAGGGHEACPSCPTALLPSPAARGPIFLAAPSPRAWQPQQRTLSFLSVQLTFLLFPWLFTCSSLPLLSRPFSVVGYTLSLPESLSPTLLWHMPGPPFLRRPPCLPSCPHVPQGEEEEGCWPFRGLRSCPGVGGAPPVLLLLHVPFLLLSSWPLSPPAAGPHPRRGSRCRQKAIQGPTRTLHSRLEANPGSKEKETTRVGWRDQTLKVTKTRKKEEEDGGGAPGQGRGEKGTQRQAEAMEQREQDSAPVGAGAHGSIWAQTLWPVCCHRALTGSLGVQSGSGVCPQPQGLHACWMAGTPASVCPGTVRDARHSSVPETAKRASHSHLLHICKAPPEILPVLGG